MSNQVIDCVFQDIPQLKLSSIGLKSGEYGSKKKENATETLNDFLKRMHLVNCTVVKDYNALVLRVGIHLRQLAENLVEIQRGRTYSTMHHVIDNKIQKILPINRSQNYMHSFVPIQ